MRSICLRKAMKTKLEIKSHSICRNLRHLAEKKHYLTIGHLNQDSDQADAGSQENGNRGDAQQLGIYNTHTRIERLPGARQTQDSDKFPMWQCMDKENKDHSKYYLPRQSNKMSEENCKAQ
ncbi:hypothetical protein Pmani_003429 [Petrolisthes manimaculis]|uniref:Uncharacterized protein n=1 Tax=Petrolisthes manimaculis TaxID=1843537 RepID=A0AAE1QGJ2_9EUCA|nr:hypothetical protein Pmani_003429 [Petrolisthes manimaculis]